MARGIVLLELPILKILLHHRTSAKW